MKKNFLVFPKLFSRCMPALLLLTLSSWSAVSDSSPTKSKEKSPDPVSTPQDSAASTTASGSAAKSDSHLLPEVVSPGERILWGEHGFMRSTGIYPLTEESREKELGLRRTMLTAHEIGGFLTLAAMITAVTYGQLTLSDNTSYGNTHKTWADVTILSYFTTAALSLLTPPPMVRRKEWSTISIHKGLALIHFTGMVLTPLLADGVAAHERGQGQSTITINHDKAQIHQISGYITTVAFASAMAVITF